MTQKNGTRARLRFWHDSYAHLKSGTLVFAPWNHLESIIDPHMPILGLHGDVECLRSGGNTHLARPLARPTPEMALGVMY